MAQNAPKGLDTFGLTIVECVVYVLRRPWGDIIAWTGIQEGLIDLSIRHNYIHKLVNKLVSVYMGTLKQYESQKLLALNNCNIRIGSGGCGCTDELP